MPSTPTTSPIELIHRAQSGDVVAFQTLVSTQSQRLLRGALTLCRHQQLAEDLVQDTLLEAWRALSRFDGRCQFSTWLYGILRHRFLKLAARQPLQQLPEELADGLPDSGAGPTGAAEVAEQAALLRRAVSQLPPQHRLVIELRFLADASLDEIAATLDIPLGTVKSRLHHGLEKLREQQVFVQLSFCSAESRSRQL